VTRLAVVAILGLACIAGCGGSPEVAAVTEASPSTTSAVPSVAPMTAAPTSTGSHLVGTVVEVVDGDTIRVELPTGVDTIRIIGIDTPEVVAPDRPESCFGKEATAFATEALQGKTVTLEIDPTQDERDRFDRLLAHVYVGDELYATEAIENGYGIHYVYEVPSTHAAQLDAAANTARDASVGIWAACEGRVDLPLVSVEPVPLAEPEPKPPSGDCHPSYDPCVPNSDHDLDCKDIGFQVAVIGPDEYRLDGEDNDGRGCESY
jgi:micrococcal nuclease